MSITPFQFEALPDEILLEIFKYVEPIDLPSFFGHNQRINNVVRDIKVNLAIQPHQTEDNDVNYLSILLAKQVIRLELRFRWDALSTFIYRFDELRSLKIDCCYLSSHQYYHLLTVNLPYLERFFIENVPDYYTKQLFGAIIDNEHFPSLKICRFSGEFDYLFDGDEEYQSPNNTLCSLTLDKFFGRDLHFLLNRLPNLRRLETNLIVPTIDSLHPIVQHTLLEKLRLTVEDPLNDLNVILPYAPLLKQLRITGKIGEKTVLLYFEALAKILRSETKDLQQFDCELYFHSWSIQASILVIQRLHPLFKEIQCHRGSNINRCYTTDLSEYPRNSKYSYIAEQREPISDYWELTEPEHNNLYDGDYDNNDLFDDQHWDDILPGLAPDSDSTDDDT